MINVRGSAASVRSEQEPPIRRRRPAAQPVPRALSRFVGREREIALLNSWLDQGSPVQVFGPRGVGKSALLGQLAAQCAARGRDVVFLTAAGQAVEDVVQVLFQACYDVVDYRPEPSRLRRLMGSVQALVVIDDFTASPDGLTTLLDAAPSCEVIVVSAERSMGNEGQVLELGGLAVDPALELIEQGLGRRLRDIERRAAWDLWSAVQGNPLALLQAGAALRSAHPRAVPLGTAPARLAGALATGLTSAARGVLGALCALDGIVVSPGLLQVLTADAACANGLWQLQHARLAAQEASGYSAASPLAQWVATSAGLSPNPAQYVLPLVMWARGHRSDRTAIAAAAPVVVRVLEASVSQGSYGPARDLARATAPGLARTLRWGAWRQVLALGQQAANGLGSTTDRAYFHHEDQIRRRALGQGIAIGLGLGAAAAIGHHAGRSGAAGTAPPSPPPPDGSPAGSLSTSGAGGGHPIIIAIATTVALSAAVIGAYAVTREQTSSGPSASPSLPFSTSSQLTVTPNPTSTPDRTPSLRSTTPTPDRTPSSPTEETGPKSDVAALWGTWHNSEHDVTINVPAIDERHAWHEAKLSTPTYQDCPAKVASYQDDFLLDFAYCKSGTDYADYANVSIDLTEAGSFTILSSSIVGSKKDRILGTYTKVSEPPDLSLNSTATDSDPEVLAHLAH
ncbi:ATP-binding protein [Streptomyces phaeochromogenes]